MGIFIKMKVKKGLKKFYGLAKMQTKRKLVYPFSFLVWAIIHPVGLLVSYFLWNSIYKAMEKTVIRGFTFSEMITYNLFTTIIGTVTFSAVVWRIGSDVRYGRLLRKVIKPIKHVNYLLLKDLGGRLVATLIEAIPTLLLGMFFLPIIELGGMNMVLGTMATALSFLLNFYLYYTVGLLAFWTKKEKGLVKMIMTLTSFLDGAMIPLDLFPKIFQQVVSFLPFKYRIYSPAMIFLGKYSLIRSLRVFMIQLTWIGIFYFIQTQLFKKAYSRFSSVGA